jgi:enamine deaminase RidA (YjgF/YER057c/UK114 family)
MYAVFLPYAEKSRIGERFFRGTRHAVTTSGSGLGFWIAKAFVAANGGKTVYISGQTAWDAQRQIIGGIDLAQQARQALRNVQAAVEAVGGTLADVVALRIYIVNYRPEQADAVGGALREFFPKEKRPASTWIGVSALAVSDFLIEIEATAVLE